MGLHLLQADAKSEDPISLLLVGEGFDAGEFFAFQKFQRCAAAGGDVSDFVGDAGRMDGGYGVAAADDGNGTTVFGYGLGDLEGAFGERGDFEDAHGAVPNDGAGGGDGFGEFFDRLRADVEAHHV
jgi:hypothetical protein